MTLLNLVNKIGLKAYKVSATQGGEYKSSCPRCGGTDRFYIQPNKQMKNCVGYYRCRQCNYYGDTIQFAIDFCEMNFLEAAQLVNAQLLKKPYSPTIPARKRFKPSVVKSASEIWQKKAQTLVDWTHNNINKEKGILKALYKRGIPYDTIKKYCIGWCPQNIWYNKSDWEIEVQNNTKPCLWIPKGIVIPSFDRKGNIQRIKIRRTNWKASDKIGKYIAVPGSSNGLITIGSHHNDLMIVVESELDAYAIHFAVPDYAFVVAIGSNIKNPDNIIDFLAKKKSLLLCYDNDNGGKTMLSKWKNLYPHAHPYPVPIGKDIGEAVEQGLKIRPWILQYKWNKDRNQELIDYILKYINNRIITRTSYNNLEREIFMGPSSPRARIGTLQKGLKLMELLIDKHK